MFPGMKKPAGEGGLLGEGGSLRSVARGPEAGGFGLLHRAEPAVAFFRSDLGGFVIAAVRCVVDSFAFAVDVALDQARAFRAGGGLRCRCHCHQIRGCCYDHERRYGCRLRGCCYDHGLRGCCYDHELRGCSYNHERRGCRGLWYGGRFEGCRRRRRCCCHGRGDPGGGGQPEYQQPATTARHADDQGERTHTHLPIAARLPTSLECLHSILPLQRGGCA